MTELKRAIGDLAGDIETRAAQIEQLALTVRHHQLHQVREYSDRLNAGFYAMPFVDSAETLLGLIGDLAEKIADDAAKLAEVSEHSLPSSLPLPGIVKADESEGAPILRVVSNA